jgi:hypothetical protein
VTESIKDQGPFDPGLFELQLGAAERTAESESLRWLMGKAVSLIAKGDVYGRKWDEEHIAPILKSVLEREYHQHLIYLALKEGHASVRDISKRTGLDLLRISQLLSELEKTNQAVFKGHQNRAPQFEAA